MSIRRVVFGVALIGLVLGFAARASAQPPPSTTTTTPPSPNADADPTATFQWDDPNMKEAFKTCMEVVHAVANGRPGDAPGAPAQWPHQDPPAGVDKDLYKEAVDNGWFQDPIHHAITYRPRCNVLLPEHWEIRVPYRYYSDVFTRCMEVVGGDTSKKRPKVVPAWYWFTSLRAGDCYLLLPLDAFGLEPNASNETDASDWSTWTADQEPEDPNPSSATDALRSEYQACLKYIDWRMEHGHAGLSGLGSEYDDPPHGASPPRVWQEAINFYVDPNDGLDRSVIGQVGQAFTNGWEETGPANWRPNCELLLVTHDCQVSGPSNPSLLPEACIGPHATANYDIGWSEYDDPNEDGTPSISRNLWGASTQYAFMLGKGGVQVALWAVDWAFNFEVSQYNRLALDVGDNYDSLLGNPRLRLHDLFWLLLIGWAGFMALTGRFAAAGSELLVTIVLLLLGTFLLTNREMYMNATWRLMDEGETTLLVAGMGDDPEDASAAQRAETIKELQEQIHFAFVEEPYDYLNWGQALGSADAPTCSSVQPPQPSNCNPLRNCAAARDYILGRGPHGADKWPRQQMAAADGENGPCDALVEFNRNPNGTRLLGAILVMLSALAVAVMLIVVGLTVVVCKVLAILLFAVVPFVTLLAILPAYGRRLTWTWAATLMQVVIAVLGMSFLLSLLLLTLRALVDVTGQVDLIERFALMDLLVAIVYVARRNLLHSGQRFAARLSEFLSSTRGSGATWASAAASAGPGLDLLNVDRGMLYGSAYGIGGPAVVAGRSVLLRAQERRVARRSYRNLERVSEWKRARNAQGARRAAVWRRTPVIRHFPVPIRYRPLP